MENETERVVFVTMYLIDAMESMAHTFTFTREGWANMPGNDEHLPLGFLPPLLMEGRWFAFFCPEIIAEQAWRPEILERFGAAAEMVQTQFDAYLEWVRMHMHLHIIHAGITDAVVREREVAEQLARLNPLAAIVATRLHADAAH